MRIRRWASLNKFNSIGEDNFGSELEQYTWLIAIAVPAAAAALGGNVPGHAHLSSIQNTPEKRKSVEKREMKKSVYV